MKGKAHPVAADTPVSAGTPANGTRQEADNQTTEVQTR